MIDTRCKLKPAILFVFVSLFMGASRAATVDVSLVFADDYIPAIKEWILQTNPIADTDQNGVLSNAEALAWIGTESQKFWRDFTIRATREIEISNPALLPTLHQDALAVKIAADAALSAERDKAKQ